MPRKPAPTTKNEFLPLMAPRIAPASGSAPTPINWFTEIAPRLAEPEKAEAFVTDSDAEGGAASRVRFQDVADVARQERMKKQEGKPEPLEIVELRMRASEESRQLVAQAQAQAQSIEQEARRRGYEDGYAKGHTEGQEEAAQFLIARADEERALYQDDLATFMNFVESERQKIWDSIEPQVIELVLLLARQVIKQEVEATRNVALGMIQNALRRVRESGAIRIRVHPDDLEAVRANRVDFMNLLDGVPHLEIMEDRRVGAGGCVIETEGGNIDARVDVQIDEAANALRQTLTHHEEAA